MRDSLHPALEPAAPARRPRALAGARIQRVTPLLDERGDESGEHSMVVLVDDREVEVRYDDGSGALALEAGDEVRELTRSEAKDLARALLVHQQSVPWDDGVLGRVLLSLNEAIFPVSLDGFTARSVSDLGEVILLAGASGPLAVDVTLDTSRGTLTLVLPRTGGGTRKRTPTTQEAHDLSRALQHQLRREPRMEKKLLLSLALEAVRRFASH